MLQYLKEAGYSLYSTLKGLKVTDANRRRAETTMLYPEQRPELAPRFRGLPQVNLDTCIVCHLCEKTCPTHCIHIEDITHAPGKDEAGAAAPKPAKKKEATVFTINATLCMFCGLCEEGCPTKPAKSITLSHRFEMAKTDRADMVYGIVDEHVTPTDNPPKSK